jgi:hypothetical protein
VRHASGRDRVGGTRAASHATQRASPVGRRCERAPCHVTLAACRRRRRRRTRARGRLVLCDRRRRAGPDGRTGAAPAVGVLIAGGQALVRAGFSRAAGDRRACHRGQRGVDGSGGGLAGRPPARRRRADHATAVARNHHPRATPGAITFTNPLGRSRGPGAGAGLLEHTPPTQHTAHQTRPLRHKRGGRRPTQQGTRADAPSLLERGGRLPAGEPTPAADDLRERASVARRRLLRLGGGCRRRPDTTHVVLVPSDSRRAVLSHVSVRRSSMRTAVRSGPSPWIERRPRLGRRGATRRGLRWCRLASGDRTPGGQAEADARLSSEGAVPGRATSWERVRLNRNGDNVAGDRRVVATAHDQPSPCHARRAHTAARHVSSCRGRTGGLNGAARSPSLLEAMEGSRRPVGHHEA